MDAKGGVFRHAVKKGFFEQYNIVAMADSNPDLQGFVTDGYKIIAPWQISEYSYDFIYVTSAKYYHQIQSQLIRENNIEKEKIKLLDTSVLFANVYDLWTSYGDEKIRYQKELQYLRNTIIDMKLNDFGKNDKLVEIVNYSKGTNAISSYWNIHTVHDDWFISAEESYEYCLKRFSLYPKLRELLDMDRNHCNDIILDYGCGPGSDTVWFASECKAKGVIGMDVSGAALKNTQFRLALHNVKKSNAKLIQIEETEARIPIESESIDFINCQGVLMHTSDPIKIIKEFYRILKKKESDKPCVNIMVYSKDSTWYHLYAAYYLRYVDNTMFLNFGKDKVKNMDVDDIFECSTDGIECPKATCWTQNEFTSILREAGFSKIEYKGSYPDNMEPVIAQKYIRQAIEDDRLEEEHKAFLRNVSFSEEGYPMYDGKICCISGVYSCYL